MIDAVWLLWSRARVDYAKAATVSLLTRMRSDERAQLSRLSMNPTHLQTDAEQK
jgi:hypothetical protein